MLKLGWGQGVRLRDRAHPWLGKGTGFKSERTHVEANTKENREHLFLETVAVPETSHLSPLESIRIWGGGGVGEARSTYC